MPEIERMTAPTIEVLRLLTEADAPIWGLQVIKSTGRAAGTVYPILDRLERSGYIRSQWEDDPARPGPRRRYYELTDDGSTRARQVIAQYEERERARRATAVGRPA